MNPLPVTWITIIIIVIIIVLILIVSTIISTIVIITHTMSTISIAVFQSGSHDESSAAVREFAPAFMLLVLVFARLHLLGDPTHLVFLLR